MTDARLALHDIDFLVGRTPEQRAKAHESHETNLQVVTLLNQGKYREAWKRPERPWNSVRQAWEKNAHCLPRSGTTWPAGWATWIEMPKRNQCIDKRLPSAASCWAKNTLIRPTLTIPWP